MLLIYTGLLLLAALYFAICLIKPIKPFKRRLSAFLVGVPTLFILLYQLGSTAEQDLIAGTGQDTQVRITAPKKTSPAAQASPLPGAWIGEMSVFGWPDDIKRANDALSLHYINRNIYYPVRCHSKLIDGLVFTRCSPANEGVTGGIYVITNAGHTLRIMALNGRARGHLEGLRVLRDADVRPIPIINDEDEIHIKVRLAAPLQKALREFGL